MENDKTRHELINTYKKKKNYMSVHRDRFVSKTCDQGRFKFQRICF